MRKSILVTTSKFSSMVSKRIKRAKKYGFEIDLVDADEILNLLSIYNVNLPNLSDFKMEDILDIIKENSLNRPKWGPVI
jgi:hypothetical protein